LALRPASDTVPKSGVKPKNVLGADGEALAGVTDGEPGTLPDQAMAKAAARHSPRTQTYVLLFRDCAYAIRIPERVGPWCISSSVAYGVS
jgi:hypothetical protein